MDHFTGALQFGQRLELGAVTGLSLILVGIVVISVFSDTAVHDHAAPSGSLAAGMYKVFDLHPVPFHIRSLDQDHQEDIDHLEDRTDPPRMLGVY